jgi:hypothetical protein
MARSRLSSLVRHAEPKRRKARCYPINKSMPAREFVTPGVTIQAGADASPAGFSLKWSILYRRRSRGRLRSTRPRAPFGGLGFQVALLAPLRVVSQFEI